MKIYNNKISKMKKNPGRRKAALIMSVCVLMSGVLSGCGEQEAVPELLEPVEVSLAGRAVERGTICDVEAYTGSLQDQCKSYSFDQECRVSEILVHPGDYVQAGDTLAIMDCGNYESEQELLKAEIEYLKADDALLAKLAETELIEKTMTLTDAKASLDKTYIQQAQKAVDEKTEEIAYDSESRAYAIEQKQQQLNACSEQTNEKYLTATEDGTVVYCKDFTIDNSEQTAKAGEILFLTENGQEKYISTTILTAKVSQAQEIYTIIDNEKIELTYEPYTDKQLSLASKADIKLETRLFGEDIKGELGQQFIIYVVTNKKEDVIYINTDSLFNENGEDYVYCLVDGQREKRVVQTGTKTEWAAEITSGLTEGEEVYYPLSDAPGSNYQVTEALKEDFYETCKYEETNIKAQNMSQVVCQVDGGRLKELLVKNGEQVKKGDTLAVISVDAGSSNTYSNNLELTSLKSDYEYQNMLWQKERDKKQKQIDSMDQTDADNQQKKTETEKLSGTEKYKAILNEIAALDLKMQEATLTYEYHVEETQLKNTDNEKKNGDITITAEATGTVSDVTAIQAGEEVKKGAVLLKIADTASTAAMIYMDKNGLSLYQKVQVDIYQSEEDYTGQVISSYKSLGNRIYENNSFLTDTSTQITEIAYVKFEGENPSYDVKNGFCVLGALWDVKDAVVVDKNAVFAESTIAKSENKDLRKRFVWKVKEDNTLEKQYVTVGYTNTEKAWIIQGLQAGEQVVTER